MQWLFEQLPQHPFWMPFWAAVLVYGLRYLLMASVVTLVARPTAAGGWGRPHANAPENFNWWLHLRREIGWSVPTLAIFGLINGVLFSAGWLQYSQLYFHFNDFSVAWFVASIVLALLLHDTFFYWLHRAMHVPALFRLTHLVHHRSIHPTSFAAYSFHPTEALGEALIVTAIVYILPMHPLALLIFQTISTAYNVYGHCGREFWPKGMASHPIGRWINTSTAHAVHHGRGRWNYGFYFLFWDRWMKTLDPAYR